MGTFNGSKLVMGIRRRASALGLIAAALRDREERWHAAEC